MAPISKVYKVKRGTGRFLNEVSLPCLLPTLSREKGVNTAQRDTPPPPFFLTLFSVKTTLYSSRDGTHFDDLAELVLRMVIPFCPTRSSGIPHANFETRYLMQWS